MKVLEDALPSQTSADMTSAAKGALSRSLRLEALDNRHHQALLEGATERLHLQHQIQLMVLKISELETELGEIKDSLGGKADKAHPAAPGIARIDHSILIGKDSTQVGSLVGVSSHYSLEVRFMPLLYK